MRMREIKVGMAVRHKKSFKKMGVVTEKKHVLVRGEYPDGSPWIAAPAELIKDTYG